MGQIIKPYQILLYTSFSDLALEGLRVVASPIACLNEVTLKPFDLVAVSFHEITLKERDALVELCLVCSKNPLTSNTLLICLVPSRHRDLLSSLKNAGVDHIMLLESLDSSLTRRLQLFAENRSVDYAIDRILGEVCPYITYIPISRRREMLYCRAYRDRLVLGPHLLNLYCETRHHTECPYYKAPKLAKAAHGKRAKLR